MHQHEQRSHGTEGHLSRRLKEGIWSCPLCMKTLLSISSLRVHLKNIHYYDPQPGDLGRVESRFLECFHCTEKFHLIDKAKLLVHLSKHFPEINVNWMIRKPGVDTRYSWKDGVYKCNKCCKIVEFHDPKRNRGRRIDYHHLDRVRFIRIVIRIFDLF